MKKVYIFIKLHCKKGKRFSRPQPGCNKPNSSWREIIKLFPARKSLVNDIPAGDGNIGNLFLQCSLKAFLVLDKERFTLSWNLLANVFFRQLFGELVIKVSS